MDRRHHHLGLHQRCHLGCQYRHHGKGWPQARRHGVARGILCAESRQGQEYHGLHYEDRTRTADAVQGKAFDLSTKIEAEDFDIPGKGRNEDGTSNNSYSVSGQCDDVWNTEYRAGTSVSIGEKNGGLVLGCNPTGNSFEYTINVAEAGTFNIKAAVAAEGDGALVFKVGDKVVSDSLKYTGSSWTTFDEVSGSITLEKGEHILTMEVAKGYIDIDWFQIGGSGTEAITQTMKFAPNTLQDYYVFDMQGVRLGILSAYGFDAAAELLKSSSAVKSSGIYYLRSRTTGQMQSVRVTK